MNRVNAQTSIQMMQSLEPFINSGGTFRGERYALYEDGTLKGVGYTVYSYATPIAEVQINPQGEITLKNVTEVKYSVTTSKHTTYARRGLSRFNVKEQVNE